MKKLIVIVCVVAGVFGAVQSMLPRICSEIMSSALVSIAEADTAEVSATKEPPILMLIGKFDSIKAEVTGIKLSRIRFDRFDFDMTGVQLAPVDLLLNRQIRPESVEAVKLLAVISEQELTSQLGAVHGVENAKVVLTPDNAIIDGEVSLGGVIRTRVRLSGKIIVKDNAVVFHTEQFHIQKSSLSGLGGNIATDISLLDLKKLPFDVTVKNIVLKQGQAEIYADSYR